VEGCRQSTGRQVKAILRELNRYPPQASRLSQPLPGDSWSRPEPRAVLPPAEDSLHPYRVEVALPPWVLDGDPALRHWLFPYGGAIRLEAPQALVEEPRQWLKEALAAHLSRINRNRAATRPPIRARVLRHRSEQQ
jgi:hypothetical protein